MRSAPHAPSDAGDLPIHTGDVIASDTVEQDQLGMALAAIRFLLDRGHPVTFLPGRTVVCVDGEWFAFCDSCGGNCIGQYTSERVATAAKCWGCSERQKSARWAEVFVGVVRRHADSVAQHSQRNATQFTWQ